MTGKLKYNKRENITKKRRERRNLSKEFGIGMVSKRKEKIRLTDYKEEQKWKIQKERLNKKGQQG